MFNFLTYEELCQKMIDNNFQIDNQQYMITKLNTHGYYDLFHNYKSTLLSLSDNHKINEYDIINLREIDIDFQSLIFKYIIQIENTLKAQLYYLMAKNFGTSKIDYTNESFYRNPLSAKNLFQQIEGKKHINFNEYPAKYYIDKYNDLPPWVYLKHLPLGDTKNIFQALKLNNKLEIIDNICFNIDKYDDQQKVDFFTSHLNLIHDFRNSIAHGKRLLNYKSSKTMDKTFYLDLFSTKVINKKNFNKYHRRFMCLILSILILLNDDFLKYKFHSEIVEIIDKYLNQTSNHFINIFQDVCSFPINYNEVLITAAYEQMEIPII